MPTPIDTYIVQRPKAAQPVLKKLRLVIRKAIPKVEETVSYGVAAFKVDGRSVIYVAGYARHVSVHPAFGGTAALQKRLEKYRSGKGTFRFGLNAPIPYALLGAFARTRLKAQRWQAKHRTR